MKDSLRNGLKQRRVQRTAQNIAVTIMLLGLGAVLWVLVVHGSHMPSPANDDVSYADFLTIILTALGVMLAALTLFIGALAFFGWAWFETNLKQKSEEFLEKRFSPTDQRYVDLVEELKEDVRREAQINSRSKEMVELENSSPYDEDAI